MSQPNVILLVDDDPADQRMVRRVLDDMQSQPEVRVVSDGVQALDYLERRGDFADPASAPWPDLVLLDLNMPGMDGFTVLREVRGNPRFASLPVVVLTTSDDPNDVAESYRLGANSYVVKPSGLDELQRVLQSIQDFWFRVVKLPPAA